MVNSLTAETVEGAGLTFRACLHRGGGAQVSMVAHLAGVRCLEMNSERVDE